MCKFVVKGCPFLTVARYAQGDIVEDQCGLTKYDLCADRKNCILKLVAEKVLAGNVVDSLRLLQLEKAQISFKD